MLFILTGNIQIGKTRWLSALAEELANAGVESYGVLAPGIWRELDAGTLDEEPKREKLGIDNVLLPSGETIHFATRADLDKTQHDSQSARMGLGWSIHDEAIERVNEHLAHIADLAKACDGRCADAPGLLVIDELGQLELKAGKGLDKAVELLELGPNPLTPHAVVIVRDRLISLTKGRFERWGDARIISPTPEATEEIKSLY